MQRPRQGGVVLAAEARGWRPRWWTSGRREVEAAPRVERTSGLGGLWHPGTSWCCLPFWGVTEVTGRSQC